MKIYRSIPFIFLVISLLGCSSSEKNNKHLGVWETDLGDGQMLVWEMTETALIYTLEGRSQTNGYVIDYSTNPILFDCRIFDTDAHCIMKFLDEDSFVIVGSENEEPRPERFEGAKDQLYFNRVNK